MPYGHSIKVTPEKSVAAPQCSSWLTISQEQKSDCRVFDP